MPVSVVKTKADEKAWTRAKAQVRSQYPKIKESSPRFYALTMTIFKNMRHKKVAKESVNETDLSPLYTDIRTGRKIIQQSRFVLTKLKLALHKDFSADKRKELAKTGARDANGSYPIQNVGDLERAIKAFGRSPDEATKHHIIKRARALGASDRLPDKWQASQQSQRLELMNIKLKLASIIGVDSSPMITSPFNQSEKRRVARVLIVTDDGEIVIHDPENEPYTMLPGGGLDDGESFEDAAIREAKEETGYDIVLDGVINGKFDDDFAQRCYYKAHIIGGTPTAFDGDGSGAVSIYSLPPNEALMWLTSEFDRAAVLEVFPPVNPAGEAQDVSLIDSTLQLADVLKNNLEQLRGREVEETI